MATPAKNKKSHFAKWWPAWLIGAGAIGYAAWEYKFKSLSELQKFDKEGTVRVRSGNKGIDIINAKLSVFPPRLGNVQAFLQLELTNPTPYEYTAKAPILKVYENGNQIGQSQPDSNSYTVMPEMVTIIPMELRFPVTSVINVTGIISNLSISGIINQIAGKTLQVKGKITINNYDVEIDDTIQLNS